MGGIGGGVVVSVGCQVQGDGGLAIKGRVAQRHVPAKPSAKPSGMDLARWAPRVSRGRLAEHSLLQSDKVHTYLLTCLLAYLLTYLAEHSSLRSDKVHEDSIREEHKPVVLELGACRTGGEDVRAGARTLSSETRMRHV